MSFKKYLKDYRVDEYIDEKGRVKSKAVYIAGDYVLSPSISMGDKRLMLVFSILSWVALIGALIPNTLASRLLYVILPFIFSMFPLFLMTGSAISLISEGETMTRERAERISGRLPLSSLFTTILAGAAFLGLIVTAVPKWGAMLSGDLLFGALSLVIAAAASFVYSKCRRIKALLSDSSE